MGSGYGAFWLEEGKNVYAHRFVWESNHGRIPEGMQICHKCDRKICIRDEHFFLGSSRRNRQDCVNKDRHAKGSGNGNSKFTESIIKNIRRSNSKRTYTQQQLADRYGVSRSQVNKIVNDCAWRHV